VIYRLGFACNRVEARQLVLHRHFVVSGQRVNIPSFLVRAGSVIEVRESSRKVGKIQDALSGVDRRGVPAWLEVEKDNLKGSVVSMPSRQDITVPIREQLIVELYSK
jgi:small subunit ribosomal protein S4